MSKKLVIPVHAEQAKKPVDPVRPETEPYVQNSGVIFWGCLSVIYFCTAMLLGLLGYYVATLFTK